MSSSMVTVSVCPSCDGQGYVCLDVPYTHPAFGRLFPCLECHYDDALRDALNDAGLDYAPPGLREVQPASDAQAVAIQALLRTLERGWGFVYLWGGFGTGKTYLAESAVRTFVDRALRARDHERRARFWVLPDLMLRLRGGVKEGSVQDLQRDLQRVDLLVLDEVDKMHGTPFAREQLFTLIDRRYRAAVRQQRGVTIFTANVRPEEVVDGRSSGYFASRVRQAGFFVVPFPGADLRRRFSVEG